MIKECKQKPQPVKQNSLSILDSSEKFLEIRFFPEAIKTIYIKIVVVITRPVLYPVLIHCREKNPAVEFKEKRFSRAEIKQLRSQ